MFLVQLYVFNIYVNTQTNGVLVFLAALLVMKNCFSCKTSPLAILIYMECCCWMYVFRNK